MSCKECRLLGAPNALDSRNHSIPCRKRKPHQKKLLLPRLGGALENLGPISSPRARPIRRPPNQWQILNAISSLRLE
jgi:hypothetical protein